jgi:murein DD-endopeptidase
MALLMVTSCGSAQTAVQLKASVPQNSRFVPSDYKIAEPLKKIFDFGSATLILFSRNFAQGDAVYAEIVAKENIPLADISLFFGQKSIPLTNKSWGYRAIFAIPPESPIGQAAVSVKYSADGSISEKTASFEITDAKFKVFQEALDLGIYSDESKLPEETIKFIQESDKKKKAAFTEMIQDNLTSSLSHPRDLHFITSDFYSKRVVMRFIEKNKKKERLKDQEKIHYGLDLRGTEGSPVYAMAAGKIGLAELTYYEGNMIILNHGDGVFTYYMHMSKLLVKAGDFVNPHQQIGEVGSTGASTGSHLHVSLYIHGKHADPMSLLCLPIRD